MGAEIKITKVKCNKGTWEIQWEQAKEGRTTSDVYGLKSDDPPRPELKERLLAMRTHVAKICELPDDAELNIVPRGVREKQERRYCGEPGACEQQIAYADKHASAFLG